MPYDGPRDVAAGVLSFTGRDSDDLRTNVGESCLRHDSPPAEEATSVARNTIELHEGAGILPLSNR